MMLRFHHWIIAVSGALLLHIALAYAFFYTQQPIQGARKQGVGGIEISVSMVATAIGTEAQKEILPVEASKPEPEQEPETVIEPEPVEEVKVEPVLIPKPQLKPIITLPKKTEVTKQPQKKPLAEKVTKAAPTVKKPPQKKIQGNKSQGALATSTLEANRADTATQQGGGRVVGTVKPDYVTTLRRWLEKHKTYPKNARRRRQEGVVILAFSVTRNGSVPEFQIQKGSGYKALDEETIQMLKRAQPFPKFPKDMEGNILKIALPIQFALR